MARVLRSDLTQHRNLLLKALAAGRGGRQPPKWAWPAIEDAVRRYQGRMILVQSADEKELSKKTLSSIMKSVEEISITIKEMKDRERRWICLALGGYRGKNHVGALRRGGDILENFLSSLELVAISAGDARISIGRKNKPLRNSASYLIEELSDIWYRSWDVSALELNEGKNFKSFALMVINRARDDNIKEKMFESALAQALRRHSEESEASEHTRFR